jgi:outer membrane protein, heavy metal efflux system
MSKRAPHEHAGRQSLALALCLLVAAVGGCVHYSPQPRPPERAVAEFQARRLDDPNLRAALDKALPSRTGEWPRKAWNRADLLIAMLHFNDTVAQGRAALEVTQAGQRTAREWPNPSLNILGEYANQHDGSPLWLWGLTTDWLIDTATRRGARIAGADLVARQAQYDLAEVTWKSRIALRRAFADLLITNREATLLGEIHADRESQLSMARRQLEVGAAARGEVDRMVGDALLDEQKLNDSRRRASAARSALAEAVGVPVAALEGLSLEWEHLDDPPEIAEALLSQWRDNALLERADVRSAVAAYAVTEQALRLEVAKQYPDVHLGPAYTWDHGVKRFQFNLGLTLPVLNRNEGPIAEAEARRREAGAKLEATVAAAYAEIDEGIRQLHLARERLAQAHSGIYDSAQRIYSETERAFNAGGNDRTELVAARIARTLSELQVLDAVRAEQDALAGLEDALRRPLDGPELEVRTAPQPPEAVEK